MDNHKKNILLQNCNNLEPNQIISIVQTGQITIEEFKAAGLSQNIINQILSSLTTKEQAEDKAAKKSELLEKVVRGRVSADEIKANINKQKIKNIKLIHSSNLLLSKKTLYSIPTYEDQSPIL